MGAVAISVTHFSDPGCPFGYSASPALAVLGWRYGAQLEWRFVTIGLTETAEQYLERGYTPATMANVGRAFRRYGMPFAAAPKARVFATGRACRAIVATRLQDPEREYLAFRALQLGWFTTPLVLDDDAQIAAALGRVEGLDVDAVIRAMDSEEVERAYQADRAEARSAAGTPTELQGKSATTDGPVRYTAPSLIFSTGERSLEAGGFQPVEAYDVLIANLDPTLERRPAPEDPLDALAAFPYGLVTQEVAAIMAEGNDAPDSDHAEGALIDLVASGRAVREGAGDDAVWSVAREPTRAAVRAAA